MAEAVPFIPVAMNIASGVMQGAGQAAQGNAIASSAFENARIMDDNAARLATSAVLEEKQGVTDAERTRLQGKIYVGQTLAGYAGAGVDVGEGSPLEALSALAKESEFQALQAKFGHDQKAWQMRVQAYDLAQRAVMTRRGGAQAQQAGYAAAAGSVFGGLTKAAGGLAGQFGGGGGGGSAPGLEPIRTAGDRDLAGYN
jgi:hypothetical protein